VQIVLSLYNSHVMLHVKIANNTIFIQTQWGRSWMHVLCTPALPPSQSHVGKHTRYFSLDEWLDCSKTVHRTWTGRTTLLKCYVCFKPNQCTQRMQCLSYADIPWWNKYQWQTPRKNQDGTSTEPRELNCAPSL